MAEAIKISTGKYTKEGKVDIDGNIWTIKLPGAGTEMKLSQAQRRLKLLDKKIEADTADEDDLDKYDKFEKVIFDTFKDMFKDGTKDNDKVKEWVEDTPIAIIVQVFEDVKKAADGRETETSTT
jgi:hypothetical protein